MTIADAVKSRMAFKRDYWPHDMWLHWVTMDPSITFVAGGKPFTPCLEDFLSDDWVIK